MSWLVFLCSSSSLKPKISITSSSCIHMGLICNDFQMWVVWLHSLASSEPKMVFGLVQRTFYLNGRQTGIRGRRKGVSIQWTKKRRAIKCSWKKKKRLQKSHSAFYSSVLNIQRYNDHVWCFRGFICRFIKSYTNRQRAKLFIGKEARSLSQSSDSVIAV